MSDVTISSCQRCFNLKAQLDSTQNQLAAVKTDRDEIVTKWMGSEAQVKELLACKRERDELAASNVALKEEIEALTHEGRQGELEQANTHLAAENRHLREALESIAAEKCSPSFDERLPKLDRRSLISIIDTDTELARQTLRTPIPEVAQAMREFIEAVRGGTEKGGVFWRENALARIDAAQGRGEGEAK